MFQIASVSTEFQCQLRSESWSNLNDTYGENVPQRKISILLKGLRTHVLQPLTKVTQWGRNYCNNRSPMTLTVILRPKKKLIKSQEASRNHLTKVSWLSELKPSYRCIGSDEIKASDAHKVKLDMLRQKTLTKITMLKNRKLRGPRNVRRRFPQIQLPTRIHERKRKN